MKYYYIIILFVVIFYSCIDIRKKTEHCQNTIEKCRLTSNDSADVIISESIQKMGLPLNRTGLLDSCKRYGIRCSAPVVKDTIVGNFRVTFVRRENGNIIRQGSSYSFDNEVVFNVRYKGENIITNAIDRDSFSRFMDDDDITKFSLEYFDIETYDDTSVVLNAMICVPNTDVCYYYNIEIDDNGMCNIVDVTSTYGVSESEMINIYYNNIHHTVFSGSPIEPNSYEKRLTLTAPDSVNIVNNYIKELLRHSSECKDVKSDADIMIVSYENFDTLYLSRSPYSCIIHTSPLVNDHYNCIEVDTIFYKLIYDVIRSKDAYFVQDTIRH